MTAKKTTSNRKRSRPVEPKKMKIDKRIIGLIIIVIIIVISSAVFLYLASNSANNNEDNNTPEGNPIAVFDTTLGTMKIELFQDKLPITCNNFIKLVNDGFYDGMIFYRISDNFMIQAGRYFPDGSEKFSPYGSIEFETSPDVLHVDGAISMASTGVQVGGSAEFFICDGAQPGLDGSYAAFGAINIDDNESFAVLRDIASQPHDNSNPAGGGKPLEDIVINSITIE